MDNNIDRRTAELYAVLVGVDNMQYSIATGAKMVGAEGMNVVWTSNQIRMNERKVESGHD